VPAARIAAGIVCPVAPPVSLEAGLRDLAQTLIYVAWLIPAGIAARVGWELGGMLLA
jgi:hypothetical protein